MSIQLHINDIWPFEVCTLHKYYLNAYTVYKEEETCIYILAGFKHFNKTDVEAAAEIEMVQKKSENP